MKFNNLYRALLLLVGFFTLSSLAAKTLETLSIKNTTDKRIYVSWFYNQQYEMGNFIVTLEPGQKISVKDWDMDRFTKLFIADIKLKSGYQGYLYTFAHSGKIIDVEINKKNVHPQDYFYPVPSKRFLRSTKKALQKENILVEIKKNKGEEAAYTKNENKTRPDSLKDVIDENRFAEIAVYKLDYKDEPLEEVVDQRELQAICNKMVRTAYRQ